MRFLGILATLIAIGAILFWFFQGPSDRSVESQEKPNGQSMKEEGAEPSNFSNQAEKKRRASRAKAVAGQAQIIQKLAEQEEFSQAIAKTDSFLRENPTSERLLELRYALTSIENEDEALKWLRSYSQSVPEAESLLLDLIIESGDWTEAEELAESMEPSLRLLRQKALLFYKKSDYGRSLEYLRELRAQNDSVWARDLLFELLARRGEYNRLIEEMEEISAQEPENERARLRLRMAQELYEKQFGNE